MSEGVLGVWTDATAEGEEAFNEWYNHEHLAERVGVPGFICGQRYRATSGRPRYLAWYETEGADVPCGPAYLERLNNPSPWTHQVMPTFRNFYRGVFDITARLGDGRGGVALTVRLSPVAGREAGLRDRIAQELLPEVMRTPGVVASQLWEAAGVSGRSETAESRLRPEEDRVVDWAILVEGTDPATVRGACRSALAAKTLRGYGAKGISTGVYRLLLAIRH